MHVPYVLIVLLSFLFFFKTLVAAVGAGYPLLAVSSERGAVCVCLCVSACVRGFDMGVVHVLMVVRLAFFSFSHPCVII